MRTRSEAVKALMVSQESAGGQSMMMVSLTSILERRMWEGMTKVLVAGLLALRLRLHMAVDLAEDVA